MAIDPEAQAVLDELSAAAKPMPADEREWLDGYRAELDAVVAMQGPAPACEVVEREVQGPGGAIPLRLYRPHGEGPWPTLLFIHGGGFVAGSLAAYDIPLRRLALRSGWQIASVDYRLAPEHRFPAAPDDCEAALLALVGQPDLRARPDAIAVGGDSVGGLLATVTARRARDAGLPVACQILLYPNADLRPGPLYPSRPEHDGLVVRLDELERSLDCYLGDADREHPDVSPVLAGDLGRLAPALLVTNEYDPLRDEAEAYGRRLDAAGVAVESHRMNGMIHSVLQRGGRIAAGDRLIGRVAAHLRGVAAS